MARVFYCTDFYYNLFKQWIFLLSPVLETVLQETLLSICIVVLCLCEHMDRFLEVEMLNQREYVL